MDKKYIELFRDLAQATAASAETVMDFDREKGDENGLKTATTMRDDFQTLTEVFSNAEENYQMSKNDAAKLLIGATIQMNQLQDRINNLRKAMTGYQSDLMPKLQKVAEAEDDEAAGKIANEEFIIKSEN